MKQQVTGRIKSYSHPPDYGQGKSVWLCVDVAGTEHMFSFPSRWSDMEWTKSYYKVGNMVEIHLYENSGCIWLLESLGE